MSTGSLHKLECINSLGNGLLLEFVWIVDRFHHRFSLVEDGSVGTTILESVESDASVDWPSSPPMQQLSIEQIGGRPTALGVGSAGQAYWSLSVEPRLAEDVPSFFFDVAIKFSKEAPGILRTTYHRLGKSAGFYLPSSPNTKISSTDRSLIAEPILLDQTRPAKGPMTVRWSYSIKSVQKE